MTVLGTFDQAHGGRRAASVLLLLIAGLHLAAFSRAPQGAGHECLHRSCPMRHHADSAGSVPSAHCARHKPASPPSQTSQSSDCFMSAGCDCQGSHTVPAAHREVRAVLSPAVASPAPDLASFLVLPEVRAVPASVRDLETPPPRPTPSRLV
jgi:hypothetical protein